MYCMLLIILYRFQLWYYNKVPLDYPLKILRKMQQRVVLWISSAFWTSPTVEIKAISGSILIHLHLKKLYGKFHLRGSSLPSNHIIKSIINTNGSNKHITHCLFLNNLTSKQRYHLNSPLIDIDNRCNKFLPLFSPFDEEFSLEKRLIDSFSDHFSFYSWTQDIKNHLYNLDNITINIFSSPHSSIIISDASVRNNVAISISYIHSYDKPVIKMIHHIVNITTTEAGLFVIRCGIN